MSPLVTCAAKQTLQIAELMDWQQHIPSHSRKGYTLDVLFVSPSVYSHVPVNDSLVYGDPEHHECAFFRMSGLCTVLPDSESGNKPLKNYRLVNYEMLSTMLHVDWNTMFECDVNGSVNIFYTVLNEAIEKFLIKKSGLVSIQFGIQIN